MINIYDDYKYFYRKLKHFPKYSKSNFKENSNFEGKSDKKTLSIFTTFFHFSDSSGHYLQDLLIKYLYIKEYKLFCLKR